ncbi:MAG TPA: tetratricopeptide repeat protein [Mesorhizobium sp.]|jgi:hypothetical protein|nr:tetratricopeptide repeat protein [Mesorhizobium sp.]
MTDDSFFREVNEEIRQDQARALWNRFGPVAIAIAVAVVLATAAYVAYDYFRTSRANASGDRFSQALQLAESGQHDAALTALRSLQEDGFGAYPVLARMREASVLADGGDVSGAVAGFDAVAADASVPESLRDTARLRAAFLLVDHGSAADVAARAEALANETSPFRHSAREALGLAAWKEGRTDDALILFDQVLADEAAPSGVRERAELMAELIRGSGAAS